MSEPSELQLAVLLEEGTVVCCQWEELASRQFAALDKGDLSALSLIQLEQLHVADRLYRFELRWQRAFAAWQETGRSRVRPETVLELRARRQEFLAAVRQARMASDRNIEALKTMIMLGGTCQPWALSPGEQSYDRSGALTGSGQTPSLAVDRQG